jgi:hypothetical protein
MQTTSVDSTVPLLTSFLAAASEVIPLKWSTDALRSGYLRLTSHRDTGSPLTVETYTLHVSIIGGRVWSYMTMTTHRSEAYKPLDPPAGSMTVAVNTSTLTMAMDAPDFEVVLVVQHLVSDLNRRLTHAASNVEVGHG